MIDDPAMRIFTLYVFLAMRVVKLARYGVNSAKSANPITVADNITLTVLDCCAPPLLRLAAACAASSVVAPNPISVGATLHLANEIYEKC